MDFSVSEENTIWILIGITLNVYMTLESIGILVCSVLIHLHERTFHLLVFSLISFSNIRFTRISKYLILFYVIANGTDFLIFFLGLVMG